MKRAFYGNRGFTLIELVIVIAIISILTVIAMQTFGAVKQKGKLKRVETAMMEIDDALSNYTQEHGGNFPGLKQLPNVGGGGIIIMGPGITGGNGGPVNQPNVLNQDDYLEDMKLPDSPYRTIPGQTPVIPQRQRLKAIDELYRENLYRYIDNPLADPGTAMVNVAYIEYQYDINTNDSQWVDIQGLNRWGLSPGYPDPGGVYRLLNPWDPLDQTTWVNYPAGNFAYIPLKFTKEDGKLVQGYWLIAYGDEKTLLNSPYNKLLQDPNWPNFDPPFGDGNRTTPPPVGSFEEYVRVLMTGALVVRANIYQDQLGALI